MSVLLQDTRLALRMLVRSPGFAASALVILALGIGFNTAVFSLLDAVVLDPLPGVDRPGDLVELDSGKHSVFAYPSYLGLRESDAFSGLAAWGNRSLGLSGSGVAERVRATVVSANYFDVLGVRAASGRFFLRGEEQSGEAIAVLSDGTARRRFGSASAAVGQILLLNQTPFAVVGVAPAGFRGAGFGEPPDLWMPIGAWPRVATGALARFDYRTRTWAWMSIFGRRAPGVDIGRVRAAVNLLAWREAKDFPSATPRDYAIGVQSLARTAAGSRDPADPARLLALLIGSVAVVLLIACANLANLLLARGAARRREISVRQALGATRGRLVRQMLTESVLLALCGGAAGLLVASGSLSLLTRVSLPGDLTLAVFAPSLDSKVLLFSLLLSAATGLLFGLAPAVQASRFALVPGLKAEPAGANRLTSLRSTLIAAQVALCLLLLSSAGLFARSLSNALAIDLGFEPRGVSLASVHLGPARYDAAKAWTFASQAVTRTSALPGVVSAAWAALLPLSGDQDVQSVSLPEQASADPGVVDVTAVGPAYFRTLRIPILAGREFDAAADTPAGPPVIVVNEAAARHFWPGQSPIGRRLKIFGAERTVVGLARDSLFLSLKDRGLPLVTAPIQQLGGDGVLGPMTLLVRTSGNGRAVPASVRAEIGRLDASLPVFNLQTLEDSVGGQLLPQRFGAVLLGLFSALSLVLAALGVYAVVAGSVAARSREIGVRLALGARPSELRRMILRQTAWPIAVGVALGLPLSAAAARAMRTFLYGVTPADLPTFATSALVLVAGGLLAADLPARKAAQADPMVALRTE